MPKQTRFPAHPLLLDDKAAAELAGTLQTGFNLIEAVNWRLRNLLDAFYEGRAGPGLHVTLEDVGRTYSLLDDLRIQHAQTGGEIDKLAEQPSRLNGMRLDVEVELSRQAS